MPCNRIPLELESDSGTLGDTSNSQASLKQFLQYGPGFGFEPYLKGIKSVLLSDPLKCPRYDDWKITQSAGNTGALDSCLRMLCNRGDGILVEVNYFALLSGK
jgi:DNA-binding transcriptional MocR family regulator